MKSTRSQPAAVGPGGARAILVAAGLGERAGGDVPKQFQRLEGRMLIHYALAELAASPLVQGIVVVVPQGWEDRLGRVLAEAAPGDARGLAGRIDAIVPGGATRQESVWCGLEALPSCSHVVVHDAARPFLTRALIARTLTAAQTCGAATAALPISETLLRTDARAAAEARSDPQSFAVQKVDREGVWAAQTPQAFAVDLLRQAHLEARRQGRTGTDDTSLVLALGRRVEFVRGSWWNIKVTTAEDLERARWILRARAEGLAAELDGEGDA